MIDYSRYWIQHLRNFTNPVPFPRNVGNPFQSLVFSKESYVKWIKQNNGKRECYTSVYSQEQRKRGVIDTVLVDVDNILFGLKLWRYFQLSNIYPRAIYSGKGLHLYIDFDPIKLDKPSDVIRRWANKLPMRNVGKTVISKGGKKILKRYIDPNVIGDTGRVARIPYTVNTRVKPFMSFNLPDDIGEAEHLMKSYVMSKHKEPPLIMPKFTHNNIAVASALLELDKQPPITVATDMPRFSIDEKHLMAKKMLEDYPLCIKGYLEELRDTGELDHYQRLQLVTFLHRVGYSEEAIVNVFRKYAHDFNERITHYQVAYVIKRNLKCRSCISSIQVMGECCYATEKECKEKCGLFPSLNWWTQF